MNIREVAIGSGMVIAAALAAAVLMGPRQGISSSPEQLPRLVTVSGLGEVKVRPDMASVSTGVTTDGPTARAALARNNTAMEAVLKALKDAGVDSDDVQTSNFSVQPIYGAMQPGQVSAPKIVSYQVSNQVTAKVRNIGKLGATLDALVQAGSNQINSVSFDVKDPAAATNEARKKAIADARAKADLYAGAADASVGAVMQISEVSVSPIMPVSYRMAEMSAAPAVPIAAGQSTLSATVTVTFELR
ncbi:MAG: SIMPL domain-containing protein [Alphaproteobacteria bacterium]